MDWSSRETGDGLWFLKQNSLQPIGLRGEGVKCVVSYYLFCRTTRRWDYHNSRELSWSGDHSDVAAGPG